MSFVTQSHYGQSPSRVEKRLGKGELVNPWKCKGFMSPQELGSSSRFRRYSGVWIVLQPVFALRGTRKALGVVALGENGLNIAGTCALRVAGVGGGPGGARAVSCSNTRPASLALAMATDARGVERCPWSAWL